MHTAVQNDRGPTTKCLPIVDHPRLVRARLETDGGHSAKPPRLDGQLATKGYEPRLQEPKLWDELATRLSSLLVASTMGLCGVQAGAGKST